MTPTPTMSERFREKFPFAILNYTAGIENDGDGVATDKMQEILSFIESEISLAVEKAEIEFKEKYGIKD